MKKIFTYRSAIAIDLLTEIIILLSSLFWVEHPLCFFLCFMTRLWRTLNIPYFECIFKDRIHGNSLERIFENVFLNIEWNFDLRNSCEGSSQEIQSFVHKFKIYSVIFFNLKWTLFPKPWSNDWCTMKMLHHLCDIS